MKLSTIWILSLLSNALLNETQSQLLNSSNKVNSECLNSSMEKDNYLRESLEYYSVQTEISSFNSNMNTTTIPSTIQTNTPKGPKEIAKLFLLTYIPENFKRMSQDSKNCVIAYVILFLIGAPGNLYIFITVGREIWKKQLLRSRIKMLIWHLATADLFVCFVVIPIEIFWRLTVQWYGGDILCRICQFFRAFGLYLSSMVIICISLDRFFAIVFPLRVFRKMKHVRNMLWIAWSLSILFAAPQLLVFSVEGHPVYSSFKQCTNQKYFSSLSHEIIYNLFSLSAMYLAPLIIIIVTYAIIIYKLAMKTKEHQQTGRTGNRSRNIRRSDNASIFTRARGRALRLSMLLVTCFIICWSPYVGMTIWYMLDFETAEKLVDPRIREALFVTAVSNSCVNPIIYGNYMKKCCTSFSLCQTGTRNNSEIYRPTRSANHIPRNATRKPRDVRMWRLDSVDITSTMMIDNIYNSTSTN